MTRIRTITFDHLRGHPGLRRAAMDAVVQRQPETVLQALAIPDVGRKTTRLLLRLDLITDPEGAQHRSLAEVLGRRSASGR